MQQGSSASRGAKLESLPNAIIGHESKNWTALHDAVAVGDELRVKFLLSSGDLMSKESIYGNTPLHEAAARGFSRCVKLICSPPLKEKDKSKSRATNTIEALYNSALGIKNNEGFSALHLAVQNGHNQSSRELLMAGADPDIQNNYGDTPLHTACRYGHAGVTRILLSAMCNPNIQNFNGDTSLHITCAMGRRKLTRILLESDVSLNLKNRQGETPQKIACRKNYREIIDILNAPKRIRNRKEKLPDADSAQRKLSQNNPEKMITWSPYGCHYFPDPRTFPSPKLDTLPKEPLKPGEQYFQNLAGHIYKGPVSVGNTCYCGPFFRHIESKLSCNRKSLRKYANKTERLGYKVQALAIKTNDQIEQLTRTMIADRIRCENRRQYFNEFLQRGEPFRATFGNQNKPQRRHCTLSRSRSLELLEEGNHRSKITNSKSVDILEDHIEAIVHHSNSIEGASDTEDGSITAPEPLHIPIPSKIGQKDLKFDFMRVSERLGDLLKKTSLIMEKDNNQESKDQLSFLSPKYHIPPVYSTTFNKQPLSTQSNNAHSANHLFDNYRQSLRCYPNSSETSNPSRNSNSWECETSPTGSQPPPPRDSQKYFHRVDETEHELCSMIKALQKNEVFSDLNNDEQVTLNENGEKLCDDKLVYKELAHIASGSENMVFSHSPTKTAQTISKCIKRQPICFSENFPPMPALFYQNPMLNQEEDTEVNPSCNEIVVRNSEIKYLKKSSQDQNVITQLRDQTESTAFLDPQPNNAIQNNLQFFNTSSTSAHLNNNLQNNEYATHYPSSHVMARHIPKDAYFHELPNRPQNTLSFSQSINPGYVLNTNLSQADELNSNGASETPQANSHAFKYFMQ